MKDESVVHQLGYEGPCKSRLPKSLGWQKQQQDKSLDLSLRLRKHCFYLRNLQGKEPAGLLNLFSRLLLAGGHGEELQMLRRKNT